MTTIYSELKKQLHDIADSEDDYNKMEELVVRYFEGMDVVGQMPDKLLGVLNEWEKSNT